MQGLATVTAMSEPADDDAPRRRTGGRSARVRSAVLQATIAQLLEVGYDRLSVHEVAAAAGVAPTTVYRRWPTRAELILAALQELSAVAIEVPDTGTLEGDLRSLIRSIAATVGQPALRPVQRSIAALPDDVAGEYRRSFWADRLDRTSAVVERAIARGELPKGTEPSHVLELLIAPIWFRLIISDTPLDDDALDRWVRAAIAAA